MLQSGEQQNKMGDCWIQFFFVGGLPEIWNEAQKMVGIFGPCNIRGERNIQHFRPTFHRMESEVVSCLIFAPSPILLEQMSSLMFWGPHCVQIGFCAFNVVITIVFPKWFCSALRCCKAVNNRFKKTSFLFCMMIKKSDGWPKKKITFLVFVLKKSTTKERFEMLADVCISFTFLLCF